MPSTTSFSRAHSIVLCPFLTQWKARAVPHAPPPSTPTVVPSWLSLRPFWPAILACKPKIELIDADQRNYRQAGDSTVDQLLSIELRQQRCKLVRHCDDLSTSKFGISGPSTKFLRKSAHNNVRSVKAPTSSTGNAESQCNACSLSDRTDANVLAQVNRSFSWTHTRFENSSCQIAKRSTDVRSAAS